MIGAGQLLDVTVFFVLVNEVDCCWLTRKL